MEARRAAVDPLCHGDVRIAPSTCVPSVPIHTILKLALAWLASQPAVASVIAGATKPAQDRAEQRRRHGAAPSWSLPEPDAAAAALRRSSSVNAGARVSLRDPRPGHSMPSRRRYDP